MMLTRTTFAFQIALPVGNPSSYTTDLRTSRSHPRSHQLNRTPVRSARLQPESRAKPVEWSTFTSHDLHAKLAANNMALCLVGMSNCGKSHWSRLLAGHYSAECICVDELIEQAIEPELTALGHSGIDGMAEWMGFPTDARFDDAQTRYLACEQNITDAITPHSQKNTILDTTGSVVYLTQNTLANLRKNFLVVHLEASDDMLEFMTSTYFDTPKPVVWGDAFDLADGETPEDALRRCYPRLLRERRERYSALAHVSIPASLSRSKQLDIRGFIQILSDQLLVK